MYACRLRASRWTLLEQTSGIATTDLSQYEESKSGDRVRVDSLRSYVLCQLRHGSSLIKNHHRAPFSRIDSEATSYALLPRSDSDVLRDVGNLARRILDTPTSSLALENGQFVRMTQRLAFL